MIFDQDFGQRLPHVAGVPEAVQQQDSRPITADPHILSAAADRHLLSLKAPWKRFDFGAGR